jgi:hypothetical protein
MEMTTPERLVGARTDYLFDTVLPALRGHLAIRSGDLVELAREHGLTVPTGEPAARGPEWVVLLEALAGVAPLAAAEGRPVELLPVVRDLTDLVEGSTAPASWWQRLLGGGGRTAVRDPSVERVLMLCNKLADGVALPPELVRPLIGRFSGALTEAEVKELASLLTDLGRARWLEWGARAVHPDAWATCFDVLEPAAREAAERQFGLLYDTGY